MTKLIIYDLKDKKNAERCKIIQNLFGYVDKSNKGQYTYKREGKLSNINFIKENKTILSFNSEKEMKKTIKILKEMKIKFSLASV